MKNNDNCKMKELFSEDKLEQNSRVPNVRMNNLCHAHDTISYENFFFLAN